MRSDHPGGWDDVIAFMEEKEILVPVASGRTFDPSEIVERYPTGEAAAMLCHSLKAHGWYLPGDPMWLKPCSEWTHQFHLTKGGS